MAAVSNNGGHTIEGTWHQSSKFTKGGYDWPVAEFHNVSAPKEEVTAVGGDGDGEMGEFETRQLWKLVAKGIREGNFEMAGKEKSRIEVCRLFRVWDIVIKDYRSRTSNGNDVKTKLLKGPLGS